MLLFKPAKLLVLLTSGLALPGCGLYTPDIELSSESHATAFYINRIVNHVKCELRDAVRTTIAYDKANAAQQSDRKRHLQWLEGMVQLLVQIPGTAANRRLLP